MIRGGQIVDGTGSAPFKGDVAVRDGVIAAVGAISGSGAQEIEARDRIVTPGFVDVHTHYDGQATWDQRMQPSSLHGVTSVVMGNCGVGFAPCRPQDHERLIRLMEGVEDIPLPVLAQGLPWDWEHCSSSTPITCCTVARLMKMIARAAWCGISSAYGWRLKF